MMANGLLGLFKPQQDATTALLGQYYDPRAARMRWIGGTLQGLGAGLATGRPGAWAEGMVAGGQQGIDDYQRQALLGYQMKTAADERAYQRGRDAKSDQRWQTQFNYDKSRDAKTDAWNNTVRQRQMEEWQQEDEKRAAADQAWSNLRNMPGTGVPVQNYGMADQLWNMGERDAALQTIMPQPSQAKPTTNMQELEQINRERVSAGQPPLTLEGYLAGRRGNGITIGPDGTVQIGGAPGKLTEQQSKDVGFYNRASQVGPLLDQMDTALVDFWSEKGSGLPGVGNYAQSDGYRQARQAADEFLLALLRKDTGAAVMPGEMVLYGGTYLPRAGDDDQTIAQKREARARAVEGIRMGLGPAQILFNEREIQKQQGSAPQQMGAGRPPQPQAQQQAQPNSGYDLGAEQIPENTPVEGEDGQIYMKRNGRLWRSKGGNNWELVQ